MRGRHRAVATVMLAAGALAGAALPTPASAMQLWALAAGVAVGLPHGALDQPAAAARLRRRFGRRWPLPFFGFYLSLAALVVLAWVAAPVAALPPLLGFALYFGVLHAPRASLAEAAAAGGPPGAALRRLLRAAGPASIAAAVLGGAAFLLIRGELGVAVAATSVVFIGLAALTVPHMALGVALRWAGCEGSRPSATVAGG